MDDFPWPLLNGRQFESRAQAAAYGVVQGMAQREDDLRDNDPYAREHDHAVDLPPNMEKAAPFGKRLPRDADLATRQHQDLPLNGKSVVSTQSMVNPNGVLKYANQIMDGLDMEPINAVQNGDVHDIINGHHRVTAAAMLGKSSVRAETYQPKKR